MASSLVPPYLRLKKDILGKILSGEWPVSHRIPSDKELASDFGVSRLTANKAMCELADEGYVERAPGIGTFVAENRSHGEFLRVTNIAEEVRGRSHEYDNEIITLETLKASDEVSEKLQLPAGTQVFHSVIVHRDQGVPIQLEDRYINPVVAPDLMSIDLTETTPTAYLMSISPPTEVEQQIEAVMPRPRERKLLLMKTGEPCLLIKRRTWIRGAVATLAYLYHPGTRYDLSGRWVP
ncbi:MAG: histidine utilization repressor [Pseudomonadota bacterium]